MRRRNAREPLDDRSRSSRRRRGLRCGMTFDELEGDESEVVRSGLLLVWEPDISCCGGSAEDCGGGGVDLAAAVDDMVW
jgi:hypothetical protein